MFPFDDVIMRVRFITSLWVPQIKKNPIDDINVQISYIVSYLNYKGAARLEQEKMNGIWNDRLWQLPTPC